MIVSINQSSNKAAKTSHQFGLVRDNVFQQKTGVVFDQRK